MTYLILSQASEARARQLSRKLFRLSRPVAVRSADDVTQFFTSHVVHPRTRAVALRIPTADIPIHATGDGAELATLIGAAVPRAQRDKLKSDVRTRRGKRARMMELLPAALAKAVRTRAEMDAAGWFPKSETGP